MASTIFFTTSEASSQARKSSTRESFVSECCVHGDLTTEPPPYFVSKCCVCMGTFWVSPLFLDLGDSRRPAFLTFERCADRKCFLYKLELSVRGSQRDLARAVWPSGGEGDTRARTRPYWCTSCNKHCEKKKSPTAGEGFHTKNEKKKMSSSFSTDGRRAEKVGPEFIHSFIHSCMHSFIHSFIHRHTRVTGRALFRFVMSSRG